MKQFKVEFTAPSFPKPARKTVVHIVQDPEAWKRVNKSRLDSGAWRLVAVTKLPDVTEAIPPAGVKL